MFVLSIRNIILPLHINHFYNIAIVRNQLLSCMHAMVFLKDYDFPLIIEGHLRFRIRLGLEQSSLISYFS
jgi:hypothetical protein